MFGSAVFKWLLALNLFKSSETTTDQWTLRVERWTTRLYLFIFLVTIIIFTVYTSLAQQSTTFVADEPTVSTFERLIHDYQTIPYCPCTRIAIKHKTFVRVKTVLHPICSSSPYVVDPNDEWLKVAYQVSNHSYIWPMDVRKTFVAFWQTIRSFCGRSQLAIDDALELFIASSILTSQIETREYILSETFSSLNRLQRTASANFARTLNIIYETMSNNLIVSAWNTNFAGKMTFTPPKDFNWVSPYGTFVSNYYAKENDTDWCICWLAKKCRVPVGIYDYPMMINYNITDSVKYNLSEIKANSSVKGLFTDCFPAGGVLMSSLECFYLSECISLLKNIMPNLDLPLLDEKLLNKYFTKESTINDMINRLMIDEWINETSYEQFYNTCAPLTCTYEVSKRNSFIYVATAIIGFAGGLTETLRFIIPIVVVYLMNKLRERYQPRTPAVPSKSYHDLFDYILIF